ncbi:MAG: helix-turn-helix domain-containing protein [Dehalococcoidia bacterium]|nr:helix-turn-helix domain-containing protein [Dehalococcoidia bacterium]
MALSGSEIGRALQAMRRKEERVCEICKTPFLGTVRRKYCSPRCAQRAHYQKHSEAERAERRDRYWSRRATSNSDGQDAQSGEAGVARGDASTIRRARLAKRLTQRQLAESVGVAVGVIRAWERSEVCPSDEQWERISALLT